MKPQAKKPSANPMLIEAMALIRTIGLLSLVVWCSSIAQAQLRIVGAISGTVPGGNRTINLRGTLSF